MKYVLEISKLNKKIGNFKILKNVTFKIPKGSVCAFMGHNGAGKTTTIKSIMGILKFDSGTITINGVDSKDSVNSHMKVGYIPEKDDFPKIKARRFLIDLNKLYGIDKTTTSQRLDYYARIFSLSERMNVKLTSMSSGQRKKVLIIQALLHDADLLIMDEPTENLDPDTRAIFYRVIKKLNKEGKTIFISSHNLDEVQNHVNYAVIIVNGKIKRVKPLNHKSNLHSLYDRYKPKILME
jgi:ABC-2 type transport system ATP-binding protein